MLILLQSEELSQSNSRRILKLFSVGESVALSFKSIYSIKSLRA